MKEFTKEKLILFGKWLKPRLPLISMNLIGIVSLYFSLRATFNYLFLMGGQFLEGIPSFFLFGDSTKPGFVLFIISTVWLIVGWLASTKFERFKKTAWRRLWFWNMFIGIGLHYIWLISAPVYNTLLPYMGEKINTLVVDNIWLTVAVGDTNTLLLTIMFIPTIVIGMILFWLAGQYSLYSADLKEAFKKFEFTNVFLQKWFKMEKTEHWPDVVLGPDSETRELVVQPGRDRTLNNVIIGSIGTGKTAALVLPTINQDLHWMSRFINDYPNIYKREDYHSEHVKGMYLNGISVIEPSNDLCQKAFQLVKAHGIPEESVFYIDPTNPETPSINPMQGPVEKVAEAFSMVIEGLAEGGQSNFFFQQSERNHLKHYIYLLKLHKPEQEVTFDMLLKMYDNPQLVRLMHLKLKETFPENIDLIENRDERNHWAIVKQIDEWFDNNLLPQTERAGAGMVPVVVKHGEYRGQPAFYDAKAEYVQGLRNILNDIGASPLIRRVLFGKSDFDFDRHLESGGVLLVNSAKGELGGLSNVLGKLVLLSLQNAVFRRTPNISNFHHIIVDEFPDYIYQPFKEFPAQSRKYKTIVTVVAQTVAQLADKYGETYMHTLLGTLRHKMVYGDIPDFDAQLFSKMFGEKEKFEEGISEQAVSPLQEKPMLRLGNSYQKTKDAILSPSDIIFQKPFQCAVKIVSNNEPMPVKQIDANFVPKPEFTEAIIKVEETAAEIWSTNRYGIVADATPELVEEFTVEDETEVIEQIVVNKEEDSSSKESSPLVVYSGADKPLDFTYDRDELLDNDEEEIPLKAEKHSHNDETVNDNPSDKDETEEPEEVNLGSFIKKETPSVEKEPERTYLGPEQEELVKELEDELSKVEPPKKETVLAFYSDMED
ncbi:conjugal transfer protein TraG (plasmid) [Bacillus sp. S3]|nr:conjugal transfer protein TraG [Bacillus sp. S3]